MFKYAAQMDNKHKSERSKVEMYDITDRFEENLRSDGKGKKTIESYVGDVQGFMKYLNSMGTEFETEIKRFHITSYKNYLLESGYQATTINKKINSLMAFNLFLIATGSMSEVAIDLRKDRIKVAFGSEHQVEIYPEKELERLQFYIENDKKVNKRDKMIILLLMFTGVRVSELCDIKLKNIDNLTGQLKVNGKGGKQREVRICASYRTYLVIVNSLQCPRQAKKSSPPRRRQYPPKHNHLPIRPHGQPNKNHRHPRHHHPLRL
jgi:site-specific recombinase XerD